jgi:hypothetical protein
MLDLAVPLRAKQALAECRGIAVLNFDLGAGREQVVSTTLRLYSRKINPLPFVQEAGWALGLVSMSAENLASSNSL